MFAQRITWLVHCRCLLLRLRRSVLRLTACSGFMLKDNAFRLFSWKIGLMTVKKTNKQWLAIARGSHLLYINAAISGWENPFQLSCCNILSLMCRPNVMLYLKSSVSSVAWKLKFTLYVYLKWVIFLSSDVFSEESQSTLEFFKLKSPVLKADARTKLPFCSKFSSSLVRKEQAF